ncbi:hypothetical protein HPP92_024991 [Vanilla planifolia]|uniref:Uncharacterized protein n=1 Tax=Vanilla planifolia TaxID=51239 RepID=A0A835PIN2_VANPL|nr:hypothetical protein HPP92_024991 [Vanilla planifolia]
MTFVMAVVCRMEKVNLKKVIYRQGGWVLVTVAGAMLMTLQGTHRRVCVDEAHPCSPGRSLTSPTVELRRTGSGSHLPIHSHILLGFLFILQSVGGGSNRRAVFCPVGKYRESKEKKEKEAIALPLAAVKSAIEGNAQILEVIELEFVMERFHCKQQMGKNKRRQEYKSMVKEELLEI